MPENYEFDPGPVVTAVNRSSKRLTWQFNGKSYWIGPNERKPMNLTYVLYGIRRNPVMGTYDPTYEHQHESLIGIVEYEAEWPTTPKEQSDAIEAIDRSKLPEDRQLVEQIRVGWSGDELAAAGRQPIPDTGFIGKD